MGNDFKLMLAKSKAKQAGAINKPKPSFNLTMTKRVAAGKQDVLHGSGITKKVAQKQTTETAKDEAKLEIVTKRVDQTKIIIPETETVDIQIAKINKEPDIILDEYQSAALTGLRVQKYGCLIGAAGTGKTTVTKQLVAEIEETVPTIDLRKARVNNEDGSKADYNVAICFCSFTGRAVQQMKRALPKAYHPMCHTIHATLGYMPTTEERLNVDTGEWEDKMVFRPSFTAEHKLPYKICIIDEAGMCPINLWNELIAALPDDCRVILIGDINQLPPVQGRSVLGFAMIKWPTFTLEKIHRQAADNPIIANAHRILQGHLPQRDKKKFAIKTMPGGSVATLTEMINVIKVLHHKGLFDPLTDAIIVPQNKDTLGQMHINEKLVTYFNPPRKDETGGIINKRHIITAGYIHVAFAVGDKVMLLQNDRDRGLTNGMTGVVIDLKTNGMFQGDKSAHAVQFDAFDGEVDLTNFADSVDDYHKQEEAEDESQRQASHVMTVQFQTGTHIEEVAFQTAGQYKKITHAYAFTCHKSQGGEYPTVVILVHSANIRMLNREWLYTAVTRAQERVILLGNDRGILQAVNIQKIKGKTVKEKAEQFLALQGKEDTTIPVLPAPVTVDME